MKKMRWFIGVAMAAIVFNVAGCQNAVPTKSEMTTSSQLETKQKNADVRMFQDSAGRKVEIPAEIKTIAPSGPVAQLVLYTVCPDKMAGLAADFTEGAKKYIEEKYWALPKFGQFYGKNANLNMEALIAASPDVIVDIGQAKETVKEDMDALQEQLGIPVVFVEATLSTMEQAYTMLGELTGDTEQASKLSDYCRKVMEEADKTASEIPEESKKTVYFAVGEDGLHTNASGSIHADIIDKIGAINAADVKAVSQGGGSEVSFEQILEWQPDMILVDSQELYNKIFTDSMWAELNAVKEGKVYHIPSEPYSFINNPPSINRMIGIRWLGNLVYPDFYTENVEDSVKEFYQLFYHIELTDVQMDEIMEHSQK